MADSKEERIHVDPFITQGDLEWVFTAWFGLHSRDLIRLLDQFALETWKTAPKALGDPLLNPARGVFNSLLLLLFWDIGT